MTASRGIRPEHGPAVVPSYAMRPVGGFGVRGWRVHCGACGFLSRRVYVHVRTAQNLRDAHRHECPSVTP